MLDPVPPESEDSPRPADVDAVGSPGAVTDRGARAGPTGSGRFSLLRVGVVVIVVAAALVGWFLTRGSSPAYRMATVGTGTVEATLDSVGTITPQNQANLNFSVSGTVSNVDVSVGQSVTAGQTLATLDLSTLTASVVSAQAALASAQATLASAEASQTSTSASPNAASTGSAHATTSTAAPAGGSSSDAGNSQQVSQLQTTLTSDQTQEDTDSSTLSADLQQASSLCATSTTTSTTAPTTGGSGAPATCAEALTQASADQALVAADIKKVAQDEGALTSALEASSAGASSGSAKTEPASATTTADVTGAGRGEIVLTSATTPSTSGGGQASKPATPEQLAVDQASIDTAQASLEDAEEALDGANLVSTINGTVASVSLAVGDSVTAGSSSAPAQVVIVGSGSSYDLTTDVPVADIAKVAVGQQAVVTPDATNSVVTGRVSSIGVLATTGTSSTTYPVTVSLDAAGLGQLSGADADVEIVTQKAVDVMTVPSSAVRTVGTIHLVSVVKNGDTPTPVRVTLGTVGDVLTQVTSGLTKGESVSLASLDEPLPSTSTDTTRAGLGGLTGGRFSGLTGGGLTAGGFTGGRFGG
ncbi:MAG: HlyD family efflux transporter periplasmic adaptor subunit [Acidimicrobiales bacterium]